MAQQYHGHRGAMGMVTAQAAQHVGKLHTGQIPKGVGVSGKSHLNLPQGTALSTPALVTAETNCFNS